MNCEPKITNNSGKDLEPVFKSLREFYPFFKERHPFDVEPTFNFISDPENGNKVLGNTAYYDPSSYTVTIYVDGRHPKDILRSISHELIHHVQNCRGDLTGAHMAHAGEQGYAQKNSHLRKMESEAYHDGDFAVRDFTDSLDDEFKSSFTIYEQVIKKSVQMLLNETVGIEGVPGTFQDKMKRGHKRLKSRIIKTGANKTKAPPFDKGASSKRAKSAPPGAGALEENGEIIMDNTKIEEIVQNVLKGLEEVELKDKENKLTTEEQNLKELEEGFGDFLKKAALAGAIAGGAGSAQAYDGPSVHQTFASAQQQQAKQSQTQSTNLSKEQAAEMATLYGMYVLFNSGGPDANKPLAQMMRHAASTGVKSQADLVSYFKTDPYGKQALKVPKLKDKLMRVSKKALGAVGGNFDKNAEKWMNLKVMNEYNKKKIKEIVKRI